MTSLTLVEEYEDKRVRKVQIQKGLGNCGIGPFDTPQTVIRIAKSAFQDSTWRSAV